MAGTEQIAESTAGRYYFLAVFDFIAQFVDIGVSRADSFPGYLPDAKQDGGHADHQQQYQYDFYYCHVSVFVKFIIITNHLAYKLQILQKEGKPSVASDFFVMSGVIWIIIYASY